MNDQRTGPEDSTREACIRTEDRTRNMDKPSRILLPGFRIHGPEIGTMDFVCRRVRIGAAEDNDLVLTSATVSRRHCVLEQRRDGVVLRDLGSTNGTRVLGVRLVEVLLDQPCFFTVGEVRLEFEPREEVFEAGLPDLDHLGDMVGQSLAMRELYSLIQRVAATEVPVLLEGETGTGKELAARAIHLGSGRSDRPFVVVDCSALPPNLVEAELFGHEKGGFTGAVSGRKGLFELADKGTIFLDEIGELPLEAQPRLLRVLETGELRRVGSSAVRKVNVRVVAATNRSLSQEVDEGRFRRDLLYRLDVVRLSLPPLRERTGDLPLLISHLASRSGRGRAPGFAGFDSRAMALLRAHSWPGNVRELANVVARAQALAGAGIAGVETLPQALIESRGEVRVQPEVRSFKDSREQANLQFEREFLRELMRRTGDNLSQAAREASMDRKHLRELLVRHGLRSSSGTRD